MQVNQLIYMPFSFLKPFSVFETTFFFYKIYLEIINPKQYSQSGNKIPSTDMFISLN